MKNILLIVYVFIISSYATAQNNAEVTLKNGLIINGKLLDFKPNEELSIQTPDERTLILKFDEIEKVNFPQSKIKQNFLVCDIGFLVGTVNNDMKAPFSFQTNYNFKIANSLFMGLGTGLEFFQNTYIPINIGFSIKPNIFGVSFGLQGGYTIPISKKGTYNNAEYEFSNGFFFNPGISYTFQSMRTNFFTVAVGYRYQETSSKLKTNDTYYPYYDNDYQIINKLNRFSIRFGYSFH